MADETTLQQQAVQPTQQFDLKRHILKGQEIYGRMMPFSDKARDYNSEKMVGEQFYLYRFNGTIVTVSPRFHKAYQEVELVEVTLTGTINPRTVADANVAGGKKTVDSQAYGLDGIITVSDQKKFLKLQQAQITIQRAAKNISKMDIAKELTDAEFQELMDEA